MNHRKNGWIVLSDRAVYFKKVINEHNLDGTGSDLAGEVVGGQYDTKVGSFLVNLTHVYLFIYFSNNRCHLNNRTKATHLVIKAYFSNIIFIGNLGCAFANSFACQRVTRQACRKNYMWHDLMLWPESFSFMIIHNHTLTHLISIPHQNSLRTNKNNPKIFQNDEKHVETCRHKNHYCFSPISRRRSAINSPVTPTRRHYMLSGLALFAWWLIWG